ncbi:hypothetical protein PC120_g11642 [Phytophthora cactorum]|nr:hypothetical protein PC120_g11642 [Phytophthora cactorum]
MAELAFWNEWRSVREFYLSTNTRRAQFAEATRDIPADLSAVLVQSGDGSYKVRVSKHIATHNHDVGRDVYYSYAEARKITSPGTRGVVKTLVQGGSKKKKILRYLKEVSGKPVLPKDVENLVAKMRKETFTSEDDN